MFLAEEVVKLIGDINDLIKEVEDYRYGHNFTKFSEIYSSNKFSYAVKLILIDF